MNERITEKDSLYNDLENKTTFDLLRSINEEDKKVAFAVEEVLPLLVEAIEAIYERMVLGGRLFYVGAGTSGRLGIVDASECPPTFGVPHELVQGIIAGGNNAVFKAVEGAEDNSSQAWIDLKERNIQPIDTVIGISASGYTPYVNGALQQAKKHHLLAVAITNNPNTPLKNFADFCIEVIVGPEFVTGSTRMKAGTAQKMILNMISTTLMIKLGHIKGNKMIGLQLTNQKLQHRAIAIIQQFTGLSKEEAYILLNTHQSVRKVLEIYSHNS